MPSWSEEEGSRPTEETRSGKYFDEETTIKVAYHCHSEARR
jgi:hypothetical protein